MMEERTTFNQSIITKKDLDYSLYLVTDRMLMSTGTLEEAVEQAVLGGCTMVQLREKEASALDFYHTARSVKKITEKYDIPLIINDRLDIALAAEADGIHIGQNDLPAPVVRKLIGKDMLLGVSVSDLNQAVRAADESADYIGVGAVFATGTKTDARLVTMEELHRIRKAVALPIVVIGGINSQTAECFAGSGIDGIAVASSILCRKDITEAAKELSGLFSKLGREGRKKL